MDIRGPSGQKFLRQLNDEEKGQYSRLCNSGKGQFRLKLVEQRPQEVSKRFVQNEAWVIEDTDIGEYLPLPVIVEREGGWNLSANIKAALTFCQKCTLMQAKWVVRNPMTDRVEYLYVRRQHRETFINKWSIFTDAKVNAQDNNKVQNKDQH